MAEKVSPVQDQEAQVARKKRRAATRVQARSIVGVSLEVGSNRYIEMPVTMSVMSHPRARSLRALVSAGIGQAAKLVSWMIWSSHAYAHAGDQQEACGEARGPQSFAGGSSAVCTDL